MKKIHKLPLHIVSKIAAGEVIERPAYALKELIENAIDANANKIHITIEEAGLKKIQISDNGEGMSGEDLQEAWKPHTTSKISEDHPLIGIRTFGFRGEALASIGAVSTLSIKSRTKENKTGAEIEIKEGKCISYLPTGMPQGTIVTIGNLFSNVPARKKFLKSLQTELRHSIDTIVSFAIAYPQVSFTVTHNKKTLMNLPQADNRILRIQSLLAKDNYYLFIPVKHVDSHIKIFGFIAKPQLFTSSSAKQFLYINNRKVTDKAVALAVKEAYGTMLEPTSYPIFVLFIEMPFEMVDVNVHPRKEQVSFTNTKAIFQEVKESILEVLEENNVTFQNLSWKRNGVGTTNSYAGKLLRETIAKNEEIVINKDVPLTQLHKLYILSQNNNGITLVDQHAAHERIIFEKMRKEFIKQKNKQKNIKLTTPLTLTVSMSQLLLLEEYRDVLRTLGFTIENTTVTHIPFFLQDRNPKELLENIFENLEQDLPLKEIDTTSEEMMAFLACRTAVKAGDILEEKHMQQIIDGLVDTPYNETCPHGRPTRIFLSFKEINHLFKR